MKKISLLIVVILAASLNGTVGQSRRIQLSSEFMREKLALSQRVLEGLSLANFDLISSQAQRLSNMSKSKDWRVYQNPEYEEQSLLFRRQVEKLVKAAEEKDLDAATLAYVRMTMSCVDCHKFVRGKLLAESAPPLIVPCASQESGAAN